MRTQTTQAFSETAKTLHTNATDLFIHSTRFVTLPKVKGLLLGQKKKKKKSVESSTEQLDGSLSAKISPATEIEV